MTMKKYKALKYWLPLITAAIFMLGTLFGIWISRPAQLSDGRQKLAELFEIIEENYVDTVDIDSLIEKSLPGILSCLDPHSAYIPLSELEDANSELEGSFGGIGIQFQVYRDTVCVVEVIDGGPSEKVGMMPGDRIIAIDGKPFSVKELGGDEEVRNRLRGKNGTKVSLTVLRNGKKINFDITRGNIPLVTVDSKYMLDDSTGYVRVSRFAKTTYHEFLNALSELHHKGATDFVIDLRGNTGGYMETAILMVNEFLPGGKVIVGTRGRDADNDQMVISDGNGAFQDARVAVLIDEMSASSSEIFSGALQDNDRGLIIGRRSFGKGLVQKPINLTDGSELRLTVQRYFTPSGRFIQKEYKPGDNDKYEYEIYERYRSGELMNADSVKLHKELMFKTEGGRTVYGGGGIMPDVFVPNDTTGITGYYVNVFNAGLLQKFAYEYADLNRATLHKVKTVNELLGQLPSDNVLLSSFAHFAASNGVPARWYYLNLSSTLIVTQLKALIARNVLGVSAYYEIENSIDRNVTVAMDKLKSGEVDFPIKAVNHPEKR